MCEEIRAAWQPVKDDPSVNAVVLRAAGDRAFCAGLDIEEALRPARRRLEPRGPRRAAQPEVAEGLEAGRVRGAGHLHRRRVLLRQRGRHRHLLDDATFFDSHVTYGLVSALEPVGLMRRIGLGETLRMALIGQRRARLGRDRAAHRPGHRGRRARRALGRARTRSRPASRASRPRRRRARCGRSGSRSTGRTAPRCSRASSTPGSATRSAWPRSAERAPQPRRARGSADDATPTTALGERIAAVARARSRRAGARVRAALVHVGRARRHRRIASAAALVAPGRRASACCCATGRPRSGSCSALLRAGACVVTDQPAARASSGCAPTSPRSSFAMRRRRAGRPRARSSPRGRGSPATRSARRRRTPSDDRGARGPTPTPRAGRRGARCSPAARPVRRSASTSPTRRSRACSSAPSTTRRNRDDDAAAARRRGDRQLAARAPRRPVPRPAVRQRRPLVRAARAVHGRRLGRRRAPPPARDREPRARRAAHGARRRPRSRPTSRSVRSVVSGTAPLVPDDADAFTAKYGVPVLDLVRRHRVRRRRRRLEPRRPRASSGRRSGAASAAPTPGASCASSIPTTARVLGPDEEGLLEVKAAQLGDGARWTRTTDLARIDADGFLWILGRADQAIIRGGFKVRPDDVRAALERAPARARRGGRRPRRRAASARCRSRRSSCAPGARARHGRRPPRRTPRTCSRRYELPDEIRIVDALPRTASAQGRPRRRARPVRREEPDHGPELQRRGRGVPRRGPRVARRSRSRRTARRPRRATGRPAAPTTPPGSASSTTPATPGSPGRRRSAAAACRSASSSSTSRSTPAPTRRTSASTSSA